MKGITKDTISFRKLFGNHDNLEACKESELTRKNSSTDDEEHSIFQSLSPSFLREILIVPKIQRLSTLTLYHQESSLEKETSETAKKQIKSSKANKNKKHKVEKDLEPISLINELESVLKGQTSLKDLQMILNENILKQVLIEDSPYMNCILKKEIDSLIQSIKLRKRRRKVNAGFCLIDSVLISNEDEHKYRQYLRMAYMGNIQYSKEKKKKAIAKYIVKKERRKNRYYIRYKIRKECASKRLRHKGKFIKAPKIDLTEIAKEF